nr:hypothetical protein Iba_chr10dCG11820 [Ipomoea batatas]
MYLCKKTRISIPTTIKSGASHDGMDSQHVSFLIFAERSSRMHSTTMIPVGVCSMRAKGLRFCHGFCHRHEISSSHVQRSLIFTGKTWSGFAKENIELWQRFNAGNDIVTHNFERAEVLEEILHQRDLLLGHHCRSHGSLYVVHCRQRQSIQCLDISSYTLL